MTTRRWFLLASATSVFAPSLARAQTKPITIGIIGPRAQSFFVPEIRRRLAELGYREGPKIRIAYRHADGVVERFPQLAREVAALRCDLIFAVGPEHAPRALLYAQVSAPIVFLAVDYDPMQKGIVKTFARPGANITGVHAQTTEIIQKRFELAQETLPDAKRFLVLSDAYTRDQLATIRRTADAKRVQLTVIEYAERPYDYAKAAAAGRETDAHAWLILTSPVFADDRAAIHGLSLQQRLPSFGFVSPDGYFLVSQSSDARKMSHRAAEIGVQILRGAKAGEIPVQQSDEFELVVNLRAAKVLGLKIPQSVLVRATRVIE